MNIFTIIKEESGFRVSVHRKNHKGKSYGRLVSANIPDSEITNLAPVIDALAAQIDAKFGTQLRLPLGE